MASITACGTVGYPRIGAGRAMKKALEAFWSGATDEEALRKSSAAVAAESLKSQMAAGIDLIGIGDHTMYDHVLDWTYRFGCAPPRFAGLSGLKLFFAMARGVDGAPPLDMSKWMGTNYHYEVPELTNDIAPSANFADFYEQIAIAQNTAGKERIAPIVVGPVTYVRVAKIAEGSDYTTIINKLLPLYVELLKGLKDMGVPEVQMHEPALVITGAEKYKDDAIAAYKTLATAGVPINLVTFFDSLDEEVMEWVVELEGLKALSLDFTRGENLEVMKKVKFPTKLRLGAGVVDARSVWSDNITAPELLEEIKAAVDPAVDIMVQPSGSLMFVPLDLNDEKDIPADVMNCLAFAKQKLATVKALKDGVPLDASKAKKKIEDAVLATIDEELFTRKESFEERRPQQCTVEGGFGTTTIGSFPQTKEIRRLRAQLKKGTISEAEYNSEVDKHLAYMIGMQEALDLDVFVHGEPERTDMVEFFGRQLNGFAFTQHGWVQSYGSRYVRPPIIHGDVTRPAPMTIREFKVAQSMTKKPVKGMLTGATTIINWSFPRKDVSREIQGYQIGLALLDEVLDLEAAGCSVIQVDDPALREGLPLKEKNWAQYLRWATRSFRLSTSAVKPSTQIVTHLCYSDFEEILEAIDDMQADVLTIENSRSGDEMLRCLADYGYSRDLGPGVWDIHSPIVPKQHEIEERIKLFMNSGLKKERLWVNPDCGLKTRNWKEVIPSMKNMVAAAHNAAAGKI